MFSCKQRMGNTFLKEALSAYGAYEKMSKIWRIVLAFVIFKILFNIWENETSWLHCCPFANLFFSNTYFIKICNSMEYQICWIQYPMISERAEELGMQPATKILHAFSELPIPLDHQNQIFFLPEEKFSNRLKPARAPFLKTQSMKHQSGWPWIVVIVIIVVIGW